MNPLLIIEILLVIGILTISVTQIILPALRGVPLFPFFRESELRRLRRENAELKLQNQVDKARREMDKARRETMDLLLRDLQTPPGAERKDNNHGSNQPADGQDRQ